ncbi:hypothetical protein [Stieleria varia]|uniref:Uncharacterized protein n=1 Tax=Stieleria varia TaxID=2528005 RepID=A0A5C5ZYI4_9BACT|nr:hypothetical protein [Stieleria varia]TWT92041.1 hypothetical protein Pla52n_63370 [Stieleria varia]
MLIRCMGWLVGMLIGGLLIAQDGPIKVGPARPVPVGPAVQIQRVVPAQIIRGLAVPGNQGQTPSMTQLVKAKMDLDGENSMLILMLPAFRMEKQEGEHMVTKMRTEQRTRMVNVNGNQVEQTYTVHVPYTETIVDPMVPVSAGIKPSALDANDFEYYDLHGKSLSVTEAGERMNKLVPVFLMEMFRGGNIAISDLQREALNPDCLVITSPGTIRQQPKTIR